MDLDALLDHYFGTDDPAAIPADRLDAGIEAMRLDFGIERDGGRRFALWALLHAFGAAPDPENAFEDAAERQAARDYAWAADKAATRAAEEGE